jgi:predicted TIM-barrel fold metal-dependent hydrolase
MDFLPSSHSNKIREAPGAAPNYPSEVCAAMGCLKIPCRAGTTRRDFLLALPVATASYSGCRTHVALRAVKRLMPDFERIDCHLHVHERCASIIAGLGAAKWRALTVCVCGGVADEPYDMEGLLQETAKLHRESAGCIAWAAAFDARDWERSDFSDRTIASLSRAFDQGAVGVKMWKNIGMAIRSKTTGHYLKPDAAALRPVYELIEKADRTLLIHVADPDGSYVPSPQWRQLYRHLTPPSWRQYWNPTPSWWRMYGRPGAPDRWWIFEQHPGSPTKKELLLSRDRVIAAHPKMRVVGAHLGSNSEDLGALAVRLDTYPNFAVDLAASVTTLTQLDTETARQFIVKYQDRILYGSDFPVLDEQAADPAIWNSLHEKQESEWEYFASKQVISDNGFVVSHPTRKVRGLGLPVGVLKKIFYENPKRWWPGVVA